MCAAPNIEENLLEMNDDQVAAWTKPIVCRVEVDLPNWLN